MKKWMTKFLFALVALPMLAVASEEIALDKAPINSHDYESLQRGAKLFTNYCLNCHSASYMRYNRLQDLGLTEQQIKDNFIFNPDTKVGDLMKVAMQPKDSQQWLGAAPPDLTVVARSRGADWLYTYLRGFYRDTTRPTGWNNIAFDKVGMPHVFFEMQGDQVLEVAKHDGHETKTLKLVKAGTQTRLGADGKADTAEYDKTVADLVNYLVYMGEPAQNKRQTIGYVVLLFLTLIFLPLAYMLKKEYWKDIH